MTGTTVVELTVPCRGSFLRMVRLAASAMAAQSSFPFDQVEDIRVAVSELAMALMGSESPTAQMSLRFEFDGSALSVSAETPSDDEPVELPELAAQILDVLAPGCSFSDDGTTRSFRAAFPR